MKSDSGHYFLPFIQLSSVLHYVCVVISFDSTITLRSGHKYSHLETKTDTREFLGLQN